jgi:hypothetical protein
MPSLARNSLLTRLKDVDEIVIAHFALIRRFMEAPYFFYTEQDMHVVV